MGIKRRNQSDIENELDPPMNLAEAEVEFRECSGSLPEPKLDQEIFDYVIKKAPPRQNDTTERDRQNEKETVTSSSLTKCRDLFVMAIAVFGVGAAFYLVCMTGISRAVVDADLQKQSRGSTKKTIKSSAVLDREIRRPTTPVQESATVGSLRKTPRIDVTTGASEDTHLVGFRSTISANSSEEVWNGVMVPLRVSAKGKCWYSVGVLIHEENGQYVAITGDTSLAKTLDKALVEVWRCQGAPDEVLRGAIQCQDRDLGLTIVEFSTRHKFPSVETLSAERSKGPNQGFLIVCVGIDGKLFTVKARSTAYDKGSREFQITEDPGDAGIVSRGGVIDAYGRLIGICVGETKNNQSRCVRPEVAHGIVARRRLRRPNFRFAAKTGQLFDAKLSQAPHKSFVVPRQADADFTMPNPATHARHTSAFKTTTTDPMHIGHQVFVGLQMQHPRDYIRQLFSSQP